MSKQRPSVQKASTSSEIPVEVKKYHNSSEIRAAFRSQSAETLREALLVLRNQLTVHQNEIAPQDERLLLAQRWLESDPGASDVFYIWETSNSTGLISAVISVFAATLRLLSFHFTFHSLGLAIVKALLTPKWTTRLNNSLSGNHTETILVTLKLYNAMSDFSSGQERKSVMEAFPWTLKSLPRLLTMRRKGKTNDAVDSLARPDIRTLYTLFLTSFISSTSSSQLKTSFLEQHRDAILAVFKGMFQDHYSVVRYVLEVFWEGLWSDSKVKRTMKIHIFGEATLSHLVKLYNRMVSSDDIPEHIVADVVHHFFLAICTRPGVGICFHDRGWYPRDTEEEEPGKTKIYNKILSHFLKTLQINEDPRQQELALKILTACPELISGYWPSINLTMEPRLSSKWIANVAFFGQVISLPTPTDSFFLQSPTSSSKLFNPSPPPLNSIISNILPSAINSKINFSKGLQSNNTPLVQHCTSLALCKAFVKFREVIQALSNVRESLDESELDGQWAQRRREVEEEMRLRVPDFQIIVAFSQTTAAVPASNPQRTALLSESAQRLQWLYHECLPDVVAEARFDVGKLLQSFSTSSTKGKEKVTSDQEGDVEMSELSEGKAAPGGIEAVKRLHVLRLLQKSDQFSWAAKTGGGSSPTYFHILLRSYTNPQTSRGIKTALLHLLRHHLSQSILFQEDPFEVELWLHSLPSHERAPDAETPDGSALSDERENVIVFLDECVARCLKTAYRYMDEMAALQASACGMQESTMWSGILPSPLLMTVLEQLQAKVSRSLLSPSDMLALATYIRRLLYRLFSKQEDLRFLRAFAAKVEQVFSAAQLPESSLIARAIAREVQMLRASFELPVPLVITNPSSSPAVQEMITQMESLSIPSDLSTKIVGAYELIDYIRLVDQELPPVDIRKIVQVLVKFYPPALEDFVECLSLSSNSLWQGLDLIQEWQNYGPTLRTAFHALLYRTSPDAAMTSECRDVLVEAWYHSSPGLLQKKQNVQLIMHSLSENSASFLDLLTNILQLSAVSCSHEDCEALKTFIFTHPSVKTLFMSHSLGLEMKHASQRLIQATLNSTSLFDRSLTSEIASYWALELVQNSDFLDYASPWLPFNDPRILLKSLNKCGAEPTLIVEIVTALSRVGATDDLDASLQEFQDTLLDCKKSLPDSKILEGLIRRAAQSRLPLAYNGTLSSTQTSQGLHGLLQSADNRWLRRSRHDNFVDSLPLSVSADTIESLLTVLDACLICERLPEDISSLLPLLLQCLDFIFTLKESKETRALACGCVIAGCRLVPSVCDDLASALRKAVKALRLKNLDACILSFCLSLNDQVNHDFSTLLTTLLDHGMRWAIENCSSSHGTMNEAVLQALVTLIDVGPPSSPQYLETFLLAFARDNLSHALASKLAQTCVRKSALKPVVVNRVLQTILQHSDFFTLCQPSHPSRAHVLDLIHVLFHLHPTNTCQNSHIEPLIGLYRGTMSVQDQKLFNIFKLFEEQRKISVTSLFMTWSSTGSSSAISGVAAIRSLDPLVTLRTVIQGPVRRSLINIDTCEEVSQGSTLYDPVFLILLASRMLEEETPDATPVWVEVFRTNIFCVLIRVLSYKDAAMRETVVSCLAMLWRKLQRSTMVEKPQVLHTLGMLRNCLDSPNPSPTRLSSYTTLLLAHSLRAIFYPSNMIYPLTSRFLLQRAELDTHDVPMLFSMLYNTSPEDWKKERGWIIRFLADGMSSTADFKVLKRRHTWDLLASLFQSNENAVSLRRGILEILANLTCNSYAVNQLVLKSHLLSWIECQLLSAHQDDVVAWVRILENIMIIADFHKVESTTDGAWRQSICRSLMLLLAQAQAQVASVIYILCQAIQRLASLSGSPPHRLGELVDQAVLALPEIEKVMDFPRDHQIVPIPWKALPPYRASDLYHLPEIQPLLAWGYSVTCLWQSSMTATAKPKSWDTLTSRLLVWRALVGVRDCPSGEFARKEVVRNLRGSET